MGLKPPVHQLCAAGRHPYFTKGAQRACLAGLSWCEFTPAALYPPHPKSGLISRRGLHQPLEQERILREQQSWSRPQITGVGTGTGGNPGVLTLLSLRHRLLRAKNSNKVGSFTLIRVAEPILAGTVPPQLFCWQFFHKSNNSSHIDARLFQRSGILAAMHELLLCRKCNSACPLREADGSLVPGVFRLQSVRDFAGGFLNVGAEGEDKSFHVSWWRRLELHVPFAIGMPKG